MKKLSLIIVLLIAVSCSKGTVSSSSSVNVKMPVCYESNDKTYKPSWKTDSRLFAAVSGNPATFETTPASDGSATFDGLSGVSKVLCWTGVNGADASWNGEALEYTIASKQNGLASSHLLAETANLVGEGAKVQLVDQCCVVYIKVGKGDYSITGASFKSIGGENIAGKVVFNPDKKTYSASESEVTVSLAQAVDCRAAEYALAVQVAPGVLSKGYEAVVITDKGVELTAGSEETVNLIAGGREYTSYAIDARGQETLYCGSKQVIMFKPGLVPTEKMTESAITWSWNATSVAGVVGQNMNHIDEAKVVNDGKEVLVTSSYNWCTLVDIATKELVFWMAHEGSPHSADLLPGDCIAVAASGDGGGIFLYKRSKSNQLIAQYALSSAHTAVWMEKKERLYCSGGGVLNVYKLVGSQTDNPSLELEKSINTSNYVTGNHDMTRVDDNTLVLGGNRAAFFDTNTEKFTQMAAFEGCKGIKSININPYTKEVWYTYAWSGTSEGGYTWSSYKVRYIKDYSYGKWDAPSRYITVGDTDLQMDIYKVRMVRW